MQIANSAALPLLEEIEAAFPQIEMPRTEELTAHQEECAQCSSLREDIEATRDKPITGEVIRLLHQDLTCLSEKTLRWILPHYLRYCLSDEGQQSRMETEFLVYSFSPNEKFRTEAQQRFKFLLNNQIDCLLHFLDWCCLHPYWGEYFPGDLEKAKKFLGAQRNSL